MTKKLIQIVPIRDYRLFGQMVKKELELARKNRGTFFRAGAKERNRAKWAHTGYKGWIKLERTAGEVVAAEVCSRSESDDHWKILHAFIGWIDRHFGNQIQAVHIHYRDL
jgi:hypothetical protein